MNTRFLLARASIASLAVLLGLPPAGSAQTAEPIARVDASALAGWNLMNAGSRTPFGERDQWTDSVYGAVTAGWYWTDHFKTELDFGAGTETVAYTGRQLRLDGVGIVFQSGERTFSRRSLAVSQQFQYFRNAWFHPHLGAGALITWERSQERFRDAYSFDQVTRVSRVVLRGHEEAPRTETTVKPFVAGGFKAYMTRRSFFRADARAAFRNGVDDAVFRAGVGIDF